MTSGMHLWQSYKSQPDATEDSIFIKGTHRLSTHALPDAVATIDDDIGPSRVRAGIACKVNVGALQFLRVAVAAHGNHTLPQILDLLVHKVAQAGVDIPGRDGVDPRKPAPLVGERARQVDAPGLGDVVGCLLLRVVGNVAGHRGSDDQGSGATLFEVMADRLGAVEGAVEIGLDNFVPVFDGTVQDTGVGGAACVGNKSINLQPIGH